MVLLFLSSLAAALAPVERNRAPISPASTTTGTTTTTEPGVVPEPSTQPGQLVRRRVAASAGKPPLVKVVAGDQLQLQVTADRPGTLTINEIGVSEDVAPEAPADFDVLLPDEGSFAVSYLGEQRPVATIKVSPASPVPLR